MFETKLDAGVRSGYSRQKWMLETEVDAEQEQGLNNWTNGEDKLETEWFV